MTTLAILAPVLALIMVGLYGWFEHHRINAEQASETTGKRTGRSNKIADENDDLVVGMVAGASIAAAREHTEAHYYYSSPTRVEVGKTRTSIKIRKYDAVRKRHGENLRVLRLDGGHYLEVDRAGSKRVRSTKSSKLR